VTLPKHAATEAFIHEVPHLILKNERTSQIIKKPNREVDWDAITTAATTLFLKTKPKSKRKQPW
jgi:hypothetical protein